MPGEDGERVVAVCIDLVELERVERALGRWGDRMVGRLMDPAEAARLPRDEPSRSRAFASAIAVKEAASKALGTGWTRGVAWRQVELDVSGGPGVVLHGTALRRAAALGASGARVSELAAREGLVIAEVWLVAAPR
jgi:holo-[acyl-carrier protein] synthase